jgi:ATP adenylyltransferase/5',5'''-P-1,P-4-tetraphosphate phosphorylase II
MEDIRCWKWIGLFSELAGKACQQNIYRRILEFVGFFEELQIQVRAEILLVPIEWVSSVQRSLES